MSVLLTCLVQDADQVTALGHCSLLRWRAVSSAITVHVCQKRTASGLHSIIALTKHAAAVCSLRLSGVYKKVRLPMLSIHSTEP